MWQTTRRIPRSPYPPPPPAVMRIPPPLPPSTLPGDLLFTQVLSERSFPDQVLTMGAGWWKVLTPKIDLDVRHYGRGKFVISCASSRDIVVIDTRSPSVLAKFIAGVSDDPQDFF